jgi:hypothetical protein
MPEGAPPTAGVLRSQAALILWWVGGIVHVASAGVNPIFHFLRSRAASCLACEQHRIGCWRTSDTVSVGIRRETLTGLSVSVAYLGGRAMAVSSRNRLLDTTVLKLHHAFLSYK